MLGTLLGSSVNRVDGPRKVTGTAQYAAEITLGEITHGVLVGSSIASGRIQKIVTERAEKAPGVLLVLTHVNHEPIGKLPGDFTEGGIPGESRPPFSDDRVFHTGQ